MIGTHFIRIARELTGFALPVALVYSVWGSANKHRKAKILQDGRVEFQPNRLSFWAWPLLVAYLMYATVSHVMHIQRSPLSLMITALIGTMTAMIAISFPS